MTTDIHDFSHNNESVEDQQRDPGTLEGADEATVYEAFTKAVKVNVALTEFLLPIPLRAQEGISLIVDPKFEFEELMRWAKSSADKRKGKNAPVRPRYMANAVLSNTVKGISIMGQEVFDNGERLPLTDKRLWQIIGQGRKRNNVDEVYDTYSCIQTIFGEGADGHIIGAMNEIIDKAGYGDIDWEDENSTPLR